MHIPSNIDHNYHNAIEQLDLIITPLRTRKNMSAPRIMTLALIRYAVLGFVQISTDFI